MKLILNIEGFAGVGAGTIPQSLQNLNFMCLPHETRNNL